MRVYIELMLSPSGLEIRPAIDSITTRYMIRSVKEQVPPGESYYEHVSQFDTFSSSFHILSSHFRRKNTNTCLTCLLQIPFHHLSRLDKRE